MPTRGAQRSWRMSGVPRRLRNRHEPSQRAPASTSWRLMARTTALEARTLTNLTCIGGHTAACSPHGVKVNRALTRRWPSRLRILSPALVGLSVIVVLPAESTSRTDLFSFPTDPPAGRSHQPSAPATSTLSLNVPLLVLAFPSRGDPKPAARVDVLDQDRARPGAVALPQLRPTGAVVGGEEQRPAHTGQGGGVAVAAGAGLDVLDQDRARPGAVRLPQLPAVVPSSAVKNNVPPTPVREDGSRRRPRGGCP